jgi:hypothetical protein
LNYSDPATGAEIIHYLCLKGGKYSVGVANAPTTNGNQDIPLTFNPTGVLLSTFGAAATASIIANAEGYVGAADGSRQGTVGGAAKDATLNTQSDCTTLTTKVMRTLTEAATATEESAATADFTVPNTLRLAWNPAPPSANEIAYVAMGNTLAPELPDTFVKLEIRAAP